jgi:predicted nuclease of predicted toxin-antitoxin system
MKLLFDQNLSFRLCEAIDDIFPGSIHVRQVGLQESADEVIWEFAGRNEYAIVSQDADFADMAVLLGGPPKVIWIRTGNQPHSKIAALLRRHVAMIHAFSDDEAVCLEIY